MCVKRVVVLGGEGAGSFKDLEVEGSNYHPEGKIAGIEGLL